ncbi:MAG: PAS domain-containing protein [Pyrinomonadaceae bacterium]|nr:PAS domain-containing protein [Pyrinomonadaceae bacterium]
MPGVEILANEINTILRGRFYQPVSDSAAALFAALAALAVIILLGLAQGKYEAMKQIGVLAGLLALILFGSYFVFAYGFIVPPLVPVLASFIVAAPLALLRRSLSASVYLDERIAELLAAERRLFTNGRKRLSPDSNRLRLDTGEELESPTNFPTDKFYLPRGLEWKSDALGFLSRDLINRAVFVDSALRSIEDVLLIGDRDGQIIFANRSARRIFNLPERKLLGRNIFEQLNEAENKIADSTEEAEETLAQLTIDQNSIEREITVGKNDSRSFVLRMAAVVGRNENDAGETLGIIATLSDITQHRELQKTKNDVIALVTHELRTPLTAIQGMSEVLTEHAVEPESQRKMLLTINTEAKRLASMINEYLDITRLEAGAQAINFAPIVVESLLERILLMLEPLAAKREIKIVHCYLLNHTTVSADAERLAQMLTNIVGNAIKYSPPHTSITIETRASGGMLEIIVADEGFGISAEQLPRIFEKFYRAPQRQTTETTGTGLGLALAREIAELHGGYISAESEPNKGSTFTVHLPLAPENREISRPS